MKIFCTRIAPIDAKNESSGTKYIIYWGTLNIFFYTQNILAIMILKTIKKGENGHSKPQNFRGNQFWKFNEYSSIKYSHII